MPSSFGTCVTLPGVMGALVAVAIDVVVLCPDVGADLASLLRALRRTGAAVEVWNPAGACEPPPHWVTIVLVLTPRCAGILTEEPELTGWIESVVMARCPAGTVLPILLDGMSMPDLMHLPGKLSQLRWVHALCWDQTHISAARLESSVARRMTGRRRMEASRRLDAFLAESIQQSKAITSELDMIDDVIRRNIAIQFRPME
jgi:hypothetical protein